MKLNEQQRYWGKSFIIAGIIICLTIVSSLMMINWINNYEEQKAYEKLQNEGYQWAELLERYIKWDHESLEIIATMVEGYDNLQDPKLWNILDSYDLVGLMSSIEILMADDTVITTGGQRFKSSDQSFEQESALGPHITNRIKVLDEEDTYIVRHYIPIVKQGTTVAMLYGIIELDDLVNKLHAYPYDGKGSFCLVDGKSGDYLVDTWHDALGNIYEIGKRELKDGFDHDQIKDGMANGKEGYVVFVSETIGEYLYFYYTPTSINNWMLVIHVPESVVFSDAVLMQRVLSYFLGFEIICFVFYFVWMLYQVYRFYRQLRERGERDFLLGIYNRNRYELDLTKLYTKKHRRFACIYIDVNGLHELNNISGHEAGDLMLQRVAKELLALFGENYTYRIGGDEFVVFVLDEIERNIATKCLQLETILREVDIYVSIGYQWVDDLIDVDEVIKQAERNMYEVKRQFYRQAKFDRRNR